MKLKRLLFSALMLLSAGMTWADVKINKKNFPDENFRIFLLSQDDGKDRVLTSAEIAEVTEIDVSEKEIRSLKGIEFFTALKKLVCNCNELTTLDMSKNTALIELYCGFNQLTSLDVSKNTALKKLFCGDNKLTSLDVSNNTKLIELICFENQLTSLDVSKNTALKCLLCDDDKVTITDNK